MAQLNIIGDNSNGESLILKESVGAVPKPGTASGRWKLYFKSTGLYFKEDTGTEYTIPTGSGASTQVAYWTGTNTLAGDAGLLYTAASDSLKILGFLNVGATTGANAANMFAVGTLAAAQMVYETVPVSGKDLLLYNSAGAISLGLSTNASSETIFNETGAAINFRIEGDNAANLFLITASTDRISSTVSDIGVTPIYELLQASTGDAGIRLTLSGGASYGWFIDNSASDAAVFSYGSAGDAAAGTNDRITVTTGGSIGVGNSIPQALLHVGAGADAPAFGSPTIYASAAGSTLITARDSTNDVEVVMGTSSPYALYGTRTNHAVVMQMNGGNYLLLHTNGFLAINNNSIRTPTRPLDVISTIGPQMRLTYTDGSQWRDLTVDSASLFKFTSPTTGDCSIEIETDRTITGGVTDGYAGSLLLDPGYTAASALTVTRHNYIDAQNPSLGGAGPAALTDACLVRFDAAAGTHKAVDSGTTKVSVTLVDAWIKINVNGTIYYVPSYTSKTA